MEIQLTAYIGVSLPIFPLPLASSFPLPTLFSSYSLTTTIIITLLEYPQIFIKLYHVRSPLQTITTFPNISVHSTINRPHTHIITLHIDPLTIANINDPIHLYFCHYSTLNQPPTHTVTQLGNPHLSPISATQLIPISFHYQPQTDHTPTLLLSW